MCQEKGVHSSLVVLGQVKASHELTNVFRCTLILATAEPSILSISLLLGGMNFDPRNVEDIELAH